VSTARSSGAAQFEVIGDKDYEFTASETERRKGCCWRIETGKCYDKKLEDFLCELRVTHVGYKPKPPKEKPEPGKEAKGKNSLAKEYGKEIMETLAAERGCATPEELAQALQAKQMHYHLFNNNIQDKVFERIAAKRTALEKSGAEPPKDYFSMFLEIANEDVYMTGSFVEKHFTAWQKQLLRNLGIAKSVKQISAALPGEAQKFFHFLLLCCDGFMREVPDLDDLKGIGDSNLFWRYAGMGEDEYRSLWLDAAREVAEETLKPKPKKAAKKKAAGEEADNDAGEA
jgi:hypothetical protein